jgi:uncharacterized membrane protein YfcA
LVNGLTGFGTALTAIGLWLYVLAPPVAATLAILCSVVSQLQTLPVIWHAIEWRRVLPFILPGLAGVPIGTLLVSKVDAQAFKIGVGLFLVLYTAYALLRRKRTRRVRGGAIADGIAGLCGGVLGGLAGVSGPPVILWTDIRGDTKDYRRSILQTFNLAILGAALISHAWSGLFTREVGLAALAAVPGSIAGAWLGAKIYKRLGDRGFARIVLGLLFLSGVVLTWTSQ